MNSESETKKLKNLKKTLKKQYKQEVNEILSQAIEKQRTKKSQYQKQKKLDLWSYIVVLLISSFVVGISFIIGFFVFKDQKKIEWIIAGFIVTFLLFWLISGWYKNQCAAHYYNDTKKRYENTFTAKEAAIKKWRKVLLLLVLLLLIISVIVFFAI